MKVADAAKVVPNLKLFKYGFAFSFAALGDRASQMRTPMSDRPRSDRFEAGLKIRREVLGEAHVERSLNAATDFNWPAQQMATEKAWARTVEPARVSTANRARS